MVKPDKYFYAVDGKIFRSIRDLALKFDEIPPEVFISHVIKEKNDFANWVEFVFNQAELATKLRACTDKAQCQICMLKYLVKAQKTKRIKKFKCDKCEKAFSSKVGLSVHNTIAHLKKG